jgi:hypothetical protein
MTQQKMLWIASKYNAKGYSQEQMRYGDDCYELEGEEGNAIKNKIAKYMKEIDNIGTIAFYEKYKDYKLYQLTKPKSHEDEREN